MSSREEVEKQLKQIGCNFRFWGRSEIAELPHVLMENETVKLCVNGHYQGGFAMLCATDHRVLLIDKKPLNYLNIEDVRFELISEFDYHHRMLDANVCIFTPTKTLSFVSWNKRRLRALLHFVQQRVIELRQYQFLAQQFQQAAMQRLLQPQTPAPTYVPNMASDDGSRAPSWADQRANMAASILGTYTYSRLPHFSRHSRRRLGRYAMPYEVYTPEQLA